MSKPVFENIEVRVVSSDPVDLAEISNLLRTHYQTKGQQVVCSRTKPMDDQTHRLYITILKPRAGGENNE
ncbi:hypothetical protein MUP77_09340 [Candidatus Bathyarchaeota archaeon]|nr:hypothetical protein [Candidatus Bathyarchaeota archaeon]